VVVTGCRDRLVVDQIADEIRARDRTDPQMVGNKHAVALEAGMAEMLIAERRSRHATGLSVIHETQRGTLELKSGSSLRSGWTWWRRSCWGLDVDDVVVLVGGKVIAVAAVITHDPHRRNDVIAPIRRRESERGLRCSDV